MRISDWSSDVCSSDLKRGTDRGNRQDTRYGQDIRKAVQHRAQVSHDGPAAARAAAVTGVSTAIKMVVNLPGDRAADAGHRLEIGEAGTRHRLGREIGRAHV